MFKLTITIAREGATYNDYAQGVPAELVTETFIQTRAGGEDALEIAMIAMKIPQEK